MPRWGSPRYRCAPRGANHKRSHSCKRLAVATVLCHHGSLEEGRCPSFPIHPQAAISAARALHDDAARRGQMEQVLEIPRSSVAQG